MSAFEILALLLTIAGGFAYVNHRFIRLPASIALMAMALGFSVALLGLERLGWLQLSDTAARIVERVNLQDTLMHGMLGALLFAGALHVNIADLREQRLAVSAFAFAGTIVSAFAIALLAQGLLAWLGMPMSFVHCLLFGALISPTDPIAVLGILKQARVPRAMEIQIAGESLFNDGVGVVLFSTVLGIAEHAGNSVTAGDVALLFARETIGGAAFGFATGYVTFRLLKSIDHYQTELLLMLALVLGGYALAERLHVSAPIAAVTAGLLIGNHGRRLGMSDVTRDHLDKFWSLVDEVLNAVLFVLVGFEVIHIKISSRVLLAGIAIIPVVLVARFVSVALPVKILSRTVDFARGTLAVLTWGGLRGGISVALALSTPAGPEHDLIVSLTYSVVVFSILFQGLTLGRVARRYSST